MITQHGATPPVLIDDVIGVSAPPPDRAYDVTEPCVSDTIAWLRAVTSKPNDAPPLARLTVGSLSRPLSPTRNTSTRLLTRSDTMSWRPSGVKRTAAAPSAPEASDRRDFAIGMRRAPGATRKPTSVLSFVL